MSDQKRPNVLIIHADQHRLDCLGAYGNQQIRTPNLDALAADGVLHLQHYCSYPVCTPSRYSLLSGRLVHQHLGWDNRCTLPAGLPTFPKIFRQTGYRTAAVGKMHFTPTYLDVGFSEMVLAEQDGSGRFEDDYHAYLQKQGLLDTDDLFDQRAEYRREADPAYWQTFGAKTSNLPLEHHSTSYITRQAMQQIDQWQEGGNLLMVGYIKPHHPFDPPEPYSRLYDPDQLDLLPGYAESISEADEAAAGYFDHKALTPAALRRVMAMYYATITQIDDDVGRLIEMLKARDLYDQTIIIYTSDHGDYMGYHHLLLKGYRMYDPLMRIPLIIKPVNGQKGVRKGLSSNTDLAASLLSWCGLQPDPHMAAHSLDLDSPGRPFILAENMLRPDTLDYMLRTETYKLLVHGNLDHCCLYDLVNDPYEQSDLAKQQAYRDLLHELKQLLINEILFHSPSRVHLDDRAPLLTWISPDELAERRSKIRSWHADQTGITPLQ